MATANRSIVTSNRRRPKTKTRTLPFAFAILTAPSLLPAPAAASASCGTQFLAPAKDRRFLQLETIDIAYRSDLAHPGLSCWCGAPGRATPKLRVDHVGPFNGSVSVLVNFSSDEPCWFDLSSESDDCRDSSETFLVLATGLPLTARADADAVDSPEAATQQDSLSAGAKVGLGIGIALACIALGAMAAFLYFRRRRRSPDSELSSGTIDTDRRGGRKGPEKKRNGASSDTSSRSDEPLCPIQPVFDGFPGSMGYDDVRSLHSTINSYSPGGHSPTSSHTGHIWTNERSIEREELTAARLKSQLQPSTQIVVSYGPNPVTPTLTPRAPPRLSPNPSITPVTPSHGDGMLPLSDYADYTDYNNFSIPPPSNIDHKPSPPRPPAAPIVVSYGPNRVTPTPHVVSPTVPPDESIVNRRLLQQHKQPLDSASAIPDYHPHRNHERQFSWEADSPLLGASSMGPLPPYATTEDFEAMEKGAVRKLAEPMAQAELPPTKDGFYHYSSDVVEYELPGAGVYQPGYGGHRGRDIDEQKFLLDDVEIVHLREQKAKIRAAAAAAAAAEAERKEREGERNGEEYDLGEMRGGNGVGRR